MAKISEFLREARVEMKKVSWPTRQQTMHYTALIIVVSLFLALYLGGLDYIFRAILNRFVL